MRVEDAPTWPPVAAVTARIFILEEHAVLRAQLVSWVSTQPSLVCCGVAENSQAAWASLPSAAPDLLLMNLSFHNPEELAALRELRRARPRIPILALSIHDAPACAEKALQAGAGGYITKQHAVQHLLEAMATVLRGQIYSHAETWQCDDPDRCAEANHFTVGRSA